MVEIKDNKKLITLKEAAKISGYSADYVGQLIRSGKIPGKQIYTNITWVTTEEAIMDYKFNKQANKDYTTRARFNSQIRKIKIQLEVIKLFFQTFKIAIPMLAVLFFSFLIIGIFIIQTLISKPADKTPKIDLPETEQSLTF